MPAVPRVTIVPWNTGETKRTLRANHNMKPKLRPGPSSLRWMLCSALSLSAIAAAGTLTNVDTVFLIVMENVNWSALKGSSSAPYINNTLLPISSYCEQYYTPPGLPGSLPNYLWLEAGTNFGVLDSNEPSAHSFNSTKHLVTLLVNAGISWKSYQENISGTNCPVSNGGLYAAYHNPFVYFKDITSDLGDCLTHIRPFTELAADLANNTVARYNFITPNLCDDMHNSSGCATSDRIRNGDNWLASEVPNILASPAYQNNGALFITWDEGVSPTLAGPIGMIVVSPLAKGGGYISTNRYTHASTLRTMQEIFGVQPFLAGAAAAASLSSLFQQQVTSTDRPAFTFPTRPADGQFHVTLVGLSPGWTNVVETSSDLSSWLPLVTNVSHTTTVGFTDTTSEAVLQRFYRIMRTP